MSECSRARGVAGAHAPTPRAHVAAPNPSPLPSYGTNSSKLARALAREDADVALLLGALSFRAQGVG